MIRHYLTGGAARCTATSVLSQQVVPLRRCVGALSGSDLRPSGAALSRSFARSQLPPPTFSVAVVVFVIGVVLSHLSQPMLTMLDVPITEVAGELISVALAVSAINGGLTSAALPAKGAPSAREVLRRRGQLLGA